MYSRNTSRRGHFPPVKEHRQASAPPKEPEKLQEPARENVENTRREMPIAPPNYRGMIYDIDNTDSLPENAEGIDRLVRNDESYSDYGRQARRRDYAVGRGGEQPAFSHLRHNERGSQQKNENNGQNGLQRLIEGLQSKNFSPEDVLICAMILLMLNSSSEDDILMVLVLMMLL